AGRRMTALNRVCPICGRSLVRRSGEHISKWESRVCCSMECGRKHGGRLGGAIVVANAARNLPWPRRMPIDFGGFSFATGNIAEKPDPRRVSAPDRQSLTGCSAAHAAGIA
ncbi:MAG: hypothetical protein KGL39_58430, partial [Patescibacteria group bacterium]|nr:hypothetical protein [Patescibacteria group bacterium]